MSLKATVKVSLSEIIHLDSEGFLDLLSELATGGPLLMDIHYKVVGIGDEPNTIMLEVTGDGSAARSDRSQN